MSTDIGTLGMDNLADIPHYTGNWITVRYDFVRKINLDKQISLKSSNFN